MKFRSIFEKSTVSSPFMGPAGAPLAREVVAKLKGSGRVSFVAISVEAADGFNGAACFVVATTALALDAEVVCAARRCAVAIWACNTCVYVFHCTASSNTRKLMSMRYKGKMGKECRRMQAYLLAKSENIGSRP